MARNSTYSTTDTEFAAFLLANGLELIDYYPLSPNAPVEWLFQDSDKRRQLLADFEAQTGEARVCRSFYRAYRDLLKKVREVTSNSIYKEKGNA